MTCLSSTHFIPKRVSLELCSLLVQRSKNHFIDLLILLPLDILLLLMLLIFIFIYIFFFLRIYIILLWFQAFYIVDIFLLSFLTFLFNFGFFTFLIFLSFLTFLFNFWFFTFLICIFLVYIFGLPLQKLSSFFFEEIIKFFTSDFFFDGRKTFLLIHANFIFYYKLHSYLWYGKTSDTKHKLLNNQLNIKCFLIYSIWILKAKNLYIFDF